MKTRLNKFLAECGIASRRKSEEHILGGRVQINGKTITDLAFFVEDDDIIKFDGEVLRTSRKIYYLLNKPKGYITSTADEKGRKTVIKLINTKEKIFPIGRLDYNTTGVLLLTNDGDFANLLMHPKNNVPREYRVELSRPLDLEHKALLLKGITVEGKKGKFESLFIKSLKHANIVTVQTTEGRNHFVKKMFNTLGYFVNELERINYAGFTVQEIPVGAYRIINVEEVERVIKEYAR